ncbi:MAG TPA: hypothetical protein VFJ70_11500 [Burkholderiales bacterium]|nr:hypothetical protein [Burkholderiales bacterium]
MKITLALLAVASTALGGCVAVPVEPGPVYAAPPPPVVVVRPYYGYYYRGGPYWHRWR